VVVLSRYVEQFCARELLADQAGGVGYLLRDRVLNDDQFVDAIRTVAGGGTVMDPEVVTKLPGRRSRDKPITRLSAPGARGPSTCCRSPFLRPSRTRPATP
jgi:DNA-binding NarL/FixJ family response regulator